MYLTIDFLCYVVLYTEGIILDCEALLTIALVWTEWKSELILNLTLASWYIQIVVKLRRDQMLHRLNPHLGPTLYLTMDFL